MTLAGLKKRKRLFALLFDREKERERKNARARVCEISRKSSSRREEEEEEEEAMMMMVWGNHHHHHPILRARKMVGPCVRRQRERRREERRNSSSSAKRGWKENENVKRLRVRAAATDDDDDDSKTESFLEKMNPFKKKTSSDNAASVQRQSSPKKKTTKKRDLISSEQREQLFGNGLMGRVATGVINNLARKVGEEYEGMYANVEEAYDIARRKCERDGKLREALGGGEVIVGPVTMQMSNSMNVNGKKTDVTRIGMVASSSASGNNVASISATMESVTAGTKNVRVIATMPSGQSFEVDGVGGGGVGGNVDVMPATNDGDDANFASDVIDGEIIEASFDDAKSEDE